MTAHIRIELEMKARQMAIHLAPRYGKEGVQFFHEEFLRVSKEYTDSFDSRKHSSMPPSRIE